MLVAERKSVPEMLSPRIPVFPLVSVFLFVYICTERGVFSPGAPEGDARESLCAALDAHLGTGQEATVTHGTGPVWSRAENKDKRAFPECLLPSDQGDATSGKLGSCKRSGFGFKITEPPGNLNLVF